jgi:F-type H+-transporting ATPase subunit epsilon
MFKLTLVTPQKKLLSEVEVEELIVTADRGELNILPGHAPLMTTLRPGIFRARLKGESEFRSAAISWGYCEVSPTGVSVLADTAEWPEEINKKRAEEQYQVAQTRLQDAGLSPDEYVLAQNKTLKELARLSVVK